MTGVLGDHGAVDTAVVAAHNFVLAVARGDAHEAWAWMDRTLQLVFAQAWAYGEGLSPADAEALAEAGRDDPRWPAMALAMITGLQASIDHFVEVANSGRLGLVNTIRPVGVDLEEVTFVDDLGATESRALEDNELVVALRIFVRTMPNGQLVAGLKGSVPTSGWPPNLSARVDDDRWFKPSDTN
jgi:hypothetical protein